MDPAQGLLEKSHKVVSVLILGEPEVSFSFTFRFPFHVFQVGIRIRVPFEGIEGE
jgi:hypothetical protein